MVVVHCKNIRVNLTLVMVASVAFSILLWFPTKHVNDTSTTIHTGDDCKNRWWTCILLLIVGIVIGTGGVLVVEIIVWVVVKRRYVNITLYNYSATMVICRCM